MKAQAAALLCAIAIPTVADAAASLPPVKAGDRNRVPGCSTPGRLMAYVKARNASLEGKFEAIAVEYMRHGEEIGLRWDYAFFQMLVETGNLTFKGDVNLKQNNFAGLGATGGGEPGESFASVSAGVKAHLQHLAMYAGERIDSPVAERTRKVQEWGILTAWQKTIKGPISFADLARKWAPKSGRYAREIEAVGQRFYDEVCDKPDPRPELVQEARAGRQQTTTEAAGVDKVSGAGLARRAVEQARAEGNTTRSNLGAPAPPTPTGAPASAVPKPDGDRIAKSPTYTILNAPKPDAAEPASGAPPAVQTASAAGSLKQTAPAAPAMAKCRVWTASYGGQKTIIIKAVADQFVNFTVLDVNEGQEKREADAYIAAYAKGGQPIGEFANQSLALDKAFELCPEN